MEPGLVFHCFGPSRFSSFPFMEIKARAVWAGVLSGIIVGALSAVAAEEPAPAAGGAGAATAETPPTPARPAQHELLVRAILERRLLHFSYHGYARVVEPHAYGVSAAGEVVLHAYQTGGGSVSEPPPGWRTFTVAEMSEVAVAEVGFSGPRRSYTGERPKLDPLWAEVSARERAKSTE